jgi:hypothetical protein
MRIIVLGIVFITPCILKAMNVDNDTFRILTAEAAQELWQDTISAFKRSRKLHYEEYKVKMAAAIPYITPKQTPGHNPLFEAIMHGDYDFMCYLLLHGLNPAFKDVHKIDAFDALRLKSGAIMSSDSPFGHYMKFWKQLILHCKKDGHKPYYYATMNPNYMQDFEFISLINKKAYCDNEILRLFLQNDICSRMLSFFEYSLYHKRTCVNKAESVIYRSGG